MKKFFPRIIGMVLSMILILNQSPIFAEKSAPTINGEGAVVIEYETGKVIYSKNMNESLYPASTTKVMTALLTLEHGNLDDVITVPDDIGAGEGSSMYLLPGEKFTVGQLLEAMLVKSANDAAVMLANHVGGDVPSFAKMMNKRAKELGATNTHFNNPNGLPDPKHHTTAHDMALIAKEAMKHEKFRKIVKTKYVSFDQTAQTPETRVYRNTNRFLWSNTLIDYKGTSIPIKYDIVDGIKTGFTDEAKNCLVTTASKDGMRLISVVFKSEGLTVYQDTRTILDYCFDNFKVVELLSPNTLLGEKNIPFSLEGSLSLNCPSGFYSVIDKSSEIKKISKVKEISKDLKLPIKKGDSIGVIKFYDGNKLLGETSITAGNSVNSIFTIDSMGKYFKAHPIISLLYITGFLLSVGFAVFLFLLIRASFFKGRRRKRRKK